MDTNEVARQVVAFLGPYLAALLGKAADEVGKRIGSEVWDQVKAQWERLARKERVRKAAEAAAALPDNPAVREALRAEIARALAEDTALGAEIAELLKSEVVQQVLAKSRSRIENVEQSAQGGPTRQELIARDDSEVKGVRQIRV